MAEKIKRASNFTSREEHLLVNLVKEKYANIIENKKTDSGANKVKNEAWLQLADEFNSLSGEQYRDASVLKIKYNNLKRRSKQKFAQQKQYSYGTGGGPPKEINDTDIDFSFKEIIGTQITGMESEFGSDIAPEIIEAVPSETEDSNKEEVVEEIDIVWESTFDSPCQTIYSSQDPSTSTTQSKIATDEKPEGYKVVEVYTN